MTISSQKTSPVIVAKGPILGHQNGVDSGTGDDDTLKASQLRNSLLTKISTTTTGITATGTTGTGGKTRMPARMGMKTAPGDPNRLSSGPSSPTFSPPIQRNGHRFGLGGFGRGRSSSSSSTSFVAAQQQQQQHRHHQEDPFSSSSFPLPPLSPVSIQTPHHHPLPAAQPQPPSVHSKLPLYSPATSSNPSFNTEPDSSSELDLDLDPSSFVATPVTTTAEVAIPPTLPNFDWIQTSDSHPNPIEGGSSFIPNSSFDASFGPITSSPPASASASALSFPHSRVGSRSRSNSKSNYGLPTPHPLPHPTFKGNQNTPTPDSSSSLSTTPTPSPIPGFFLPQTQSKSQFGPSPAIASVTAAPPPRPPKPSKSFSCSSESSSFSNAGISSDDHLARTTSSGKASMESANGSGIMSATGIVDMYSSSRSGSLAGGSHSGEGGEDEGYYGYYGGENMRSSGDDHQLVLEAFGEQERGEFIPSESPEWPPHSQAYSQETHRRRRQREGSLGGGEEAIGIAIMNGGGGDNETQPQWGDDEYRSSSNLPPPPSSSSSPTTSPTPPNCRILSSGSGRSRQPSSSSLISNPDDQTTPPPSSQQHPTTTSKQPPTASSPPIVRTTSIGVMPPPHPIPHPSSHPHSHGPPTTVGNPSRTLRSQMSATSLKSIPESGSFKSSAAVEHNNGVQGTQGGSSFRSSTHNNESLLSGSGSGGGGGRASNGSQETFSTPGLSSGSSSSRASSGLFSSTGGGAIRTSGHSVTTDGEDNYSNFFYKGLDLGLSATTGGTGAGGGVIGGEGYRHHHLQLSKSLDQLGNKLDSFHEEEDGIESEDGGGAGEDYGDSGDGGGMAVGLGITADEAVETPPPSGVSSPVISGKRPRGASLSQTGVTSLDMRRGSIRQGLSSQYQSQQPQQPHLLSNLQARLGKAEEAAIGRGYIPASGGPSSPPPLASPFHGPGGPGMDENQTSFFPSPATTPSSAGTQKLMTDEDWSSPNRPWVTDHSQQQASRYSSDGENLAVVPRQQEEEEEEEELEDTDLDEPPSLDSMGNIETEVYETAPLAFPVIEAEPTAVITAEEGKAKILELSGQSLEYRNPAEGTTHLLLNNTTTPWLVPNVLHGACTRACTTLLVLDVSFCGLTELPEVLSNCSVLEELKLSSNNFMETATLPQFIADLTTLRVLVADSCNLSIIKNPFPKLQNLQYLSLRDNLFRSLPSWLCRLSALEVLLVDGNPFHWQWANLVRPILLRHEIPSSSEASGFTTPDVARSAMASSTSLASDSSPIDPEFSQHQLPTPPPSGAPPPTARTRLMSFGRNRSRPQTAVETEDGPPTKFGVLPEELGGPPQRMRRMKSAGDMRDNPTSNPPALPAGPVIDTANLVRSNDVLPSPISAMGSTTPHISSPLNSAPMLPEQSDYSSKGSDDGRKGQKWGFFKKMSLSKMKSGSNTPDLPSGRPGMLSEESRTASEPMAGGSMGRKNNRRSPNSMFRPRSGSRASRMSSLEPTLPKKNPRRSFLLLTNFPSRPETPVTDSSTDLVSLPAPPSPPAHKSADHRAGLRSIMAYLKDLDDLSPEPIKNEMSTPGSAKTSSSTLHPRTLSIKGSRDSQGKSTPVPEATKPKVKDDVYRRERVVLEIVDSEKSYLRGIQEMVEIYVDSAGQETSSTTSAGKKETAVPQAEIRAVFSNITNIAHFHASVFLPDLEAAIASLVHRKSINAPPDGGLARHAAQAVGRVFIRHAAFFKLYAPYINNFDFALSRLKAWTTPVTPTNASNTPSIASSSTSKLASMGAAMTGNDQPNPNNNTMALTAAQKKKLKSYLKRCKANPQHSQLSLESYLLLPVQRIPRYRLLLESLVSCTPTETEQGDIQPDPTLSEAFELISSMASDMNERKRDSESRQRLLMWQNRISNKFRSPLVQPHRRLIREGKLTVAHVVKRASTYVDARRPQDEDGEGLVGSRGVVQVHSLHVEPEQKPLVALLCSDLLVLCMEPEDGIEGTSSVSLYTVVRLSYPSGTKIVPASVFGGDSMIRIVDSRAIIYLSCLDRDDALAWVQEINSQIEA